MLSEFIAARARGRNVLLALALVVALFAVFGLLLIPAFQEATNGLWPIDNSFPPDAAQYFRDLPQYTPASFRAYLWFAFVDYLYPPAFAAFFALLWAWMFRVRPRPLFASLQSRGILLLPFAAALCDWLENAGTLIVLFSYPAELWEVARVAVTFKQVKLLIHGTDVLLTLGFAALALTAPARR
jgi:hypothetical protein